MATNKSARKPAPGRIRVNRKPSERGLSESGGGWNVAQASAWSGIGEASLREMAKRSILTSDSGLFPCYAIGRRILIPKEGFQSWFNNGRAAQASPAIAQGRVA